MAKSGKSKSKKPKNAKPPRAKNKRLPGMELAPGIAAIDRAAEDYVEARDQRMTWLKQEIEKGKTLADAMHEAKRDEYIYDGKIVKLDTKEKISVRTMKDDVDVEESVSEESAGEAAIN